MYLTTRQSVVWAKEALKSALSQGCRVLLWDDGSEVDVMPVVQEFSEGFKLFGGPNRGPGFARNQLVQRVETDLILPLDADDRLIPNAVQTMLNNWDGNTPVYSDLRLFGDREAPHRPLPDFSCRHLLKHVGLASVTVLHSVQQWQDIGGWREDLELYEDGVYNAVLMSEYCGKKISKPLLEYRQHEMQRSRRDGNLRKAREIHAHYVEPLGDLKMGCCGKGTTKNKGTMNVDTQQRSVMSDAEKRQRNTNPQFFHQSDANVQQTTVMPGTNEERVEARYLGGKGKGAHYYKGRSTGFRYRVQYGSKIMVDPDDAVYDPSHVGLNTSLFLADKRPEPDEQEESDKPTFFRERDQESDSSREPKVEEEREPIIEELDIEPLPDIEEMRLSDIDEQIMPDITKEQARWFLEQELSSGRPRKGALSRFQEVLEDD